MAQNTTVTLESGVWTQLTNADATSATFQNTGAYYMLVKGTTDATQPTDAIGSIRYSPGQGECNTDLADLFPGLSGVARLWALCDESVGVFVSHA